MKKPCLMPLMLATVALTVTAQETGRDARLEPVFPAPPGGLVWIEAEDAIATNFASDATLDYGSSGYRVLQLNKEGQSKSAPFYADFNFVVDSAGSWKLWIGGTPPGPASELDASFISPVSYAIDGGERVRLYREDVTVNENYSTGNYWFTAKAPVELMPGIHSIRFEVAETRKYDARYYFFLDAFFLLRSDSPVASGGLDRAALPTLFPRDLSDRSIDQPYFSIPRYEYLIQSEPKDPTRYLLLAQVYNLIGDNGSAIKTLARGRVVAGDDPRFTLQSAKSRIWSGEIDEGLRLYREYLSSPDADPTIWAEAAKISAWLMKYRDAQNLYAEAIKRFPDDANLRLNQALTFLWEGKVKEGEQLLSELWEQSRDDPARIASLGDMFLTNGYPDKAIRTFSDGTEAFPDHLDLYFRLARTYTKTSQPELAASTLETVRQRFIPSARLSEALASIERESGLRRVALDGYRLRLEKTPDDLELRQELVRAYYWNGMLAEALDESRNILVNKLYTIFGELDTDLAATYRLLDLLAVYRTPVTEMPAGAAATIASLKKSVEAFRRAEAKNAQALKGKDAAKQEKAAQEFSAASETLALGVSAAMSFVERAEAAMAEAGELVEAGNGEAAAAETDEAMLARLHPWTWDEAEELRFMTAAAVSNPLAWQCASRMLAFEGKPLPPVPAAARLARNDLLGRQAALWASGVLDTAGFDPVDWYGHGDELEAAVSALSASNAIETAAGAEAIEAVQAAGIVEQADTVRIRLEALRIAGASMSADIRAARESLLARARLRLRARIYQYDTETQQDRREMADIYLRLDRPDLAVAALSRVLAISPSDASSTFTLGRAREMSGDWHGAMDAYGFVYDINPRYESAVSSYNRLAGIHAASMTAGFSTVVDTDSSDGMARMELMAPIDSALEFRARYRTDARKIHAPSPASFPDSMTLHTLEAEVPVTLAGTGLRISAIAGGTMQNKLDNFLPASIDDFTVATISDYAAVAPRLGAAAEWISGGLAASAEYRFNQIEDTFFADRSVHYAHAGSAGISYYHEEPSRAFARSLGGRASVRISSIFVPYSNATANLITEASGELRVGNQLSASPLTTLDLGGAVSWADSTDPTADDYYAPSSVFTIKGGPALGLRFKSGTSSEVSASARFWPGMYAAQGLDRLSLDGELSAGYTKRGLDLSMSLRGAWTEATEIAASYWSLSMGFVARLALGDYIIP